MHTELQKQNDSFEQEKRGFQHRTCVLTTKLEKSEQLVASLRAQLRDAREQSAEQLFECITSEPGEDRHEHHCASNNMVYKAVTVDCPLGILRPLHRWHR